MIDMHKCLYISCLLTENAYCIFFQWYEIKWTEFYQKAYIPQSVFSLQTLHTQEALLRNSMELNQETTI